MTPIISSLLYIIAILGIGHSLRKEMMRPIPPPPIQNFDETPTHIAWLSGGARRVVDTWWTQLMHIGFLQATTTPERIQINTSVSLLSLDTHAREAAQAIAMHSHMTPGQILVEWEGVLKKSRESAQVSGCFYRPQDIAQRKGWGISYFALSSFGYLAGFAFLGWPLWLFVIPCFGSLAFFLSTPNHPKLTPHGHNVFNELLSRYQHATRAPTDTSVVIAVALIGSVALIGTPWEALSSPSKHSDANSSGGCGTVATSWGSGNSNGCGDSGCGGGGCGD